MAATNTQAQVLLLRPLAFPTIESACSREFQLLKAFDSPLPTDLFLSSHPGISALICSVGTPVTADILHLLPSLRLILTTSVGVDYLDLPECRRRRISVATPSQIFSDDTADLAVGLLIDVLRKISTSDHFVRRGLCRAEGHFLTGTQLRGRKVGVIGLGSIGSRVAKRLEAFGCVISYNSRKKKSCVPYFYHPKISELAADSNILVICCALNDRTRHLINKEVLYKLGEDGVIINVARGAIVDEKELVRSLEEGLIAGAGMDVFENEPFVPKELFVLDNVVLSPHRAVFTPEALQDLEDLIVGNLRAFFSGKPLLSPLMEE